MSIKYASSAALSVIAKEIEDAISAHARVQLDDLHGRLHEAFTTMLKQSPLEVVHAVRGEISPDANEYLAYTLGQISFAQRIVAQAAEQRADDNFVNAINSLKYSRYVKALCRKNMTNVELATELQISDPAIVSRAMRDLRAEKITIFWREGATVVNSLSASARAAIESGDESNQLDPELDSHLKQAMTLVPAHMQHAVSFSPGLRHRNDECHV
jgi:hypothetical protein